MKNYSSMQTLTIKQGSVKRWFYFLSSLFLCSGSVANAQTDNREAMHILHPVPVCDVKIKDAFWSPKFDTWSRVTIRDVLTKFEKGGAFRNFDRVAGVLDGKHEGPPWHDGLIYETIRGGSDLLIAFPDNNLEKQIDGYIERIYAAAAKNPNGYIMTYTQLDEPGHYWGLNGGSERWQHDVYNAGALVEAAVHYYQATGKTRLLEVAVRLANHMCDIMGPSPRKNIVPSHSLPEEAFVELYLLFRGNLPLREKLSIPVDERRYLELAEFWLENRGNHCGKPTTEEWAANEAACHKWIREQNYGSDRPGWGAYSQDHMSIFKQETLEGHAVRATLMCTGLSAAARVNGQAKYGEASHRLWNNMVGKRMHITGGVGSFAHEEKLGGDYVLPNDAYLETCAAVGAGFFHRNMNLLFGDAKYIDELERTLYNNVLSSVSLEGRHYNYQNPLSASSNHRWEWNDCPCCPPMFLKIISALPGYIYASDDDGLYINLFIGSNAEVVIKNTPVKVIQKTKYPWQGAVSLVFEPKQSKEFSVYVHVPGWAQGSENSLGLYRSDLGTPPIVFKVNGKAITMPTMIRGYAVITRTWNKGDTVEFELPIQPRRVYAHPDVVANRGRVVLQSGPLVYCFEQIDNPKISSCFLGPDSSFRLEYKPDLLGGVNVITGEIFSLNHDKTAKKAEFTAIPFYCQDNRPDSGRIEVWMAEEKNLAIPLLKPTIANQSKVSASHCFENDTIAALNDGVEPVNSNDHAIPRHTWWSLRGTTEWVEYNFNAPQPISATAIYWWDDRPAGGGCAVPESWRLLYQDNGQWKPVPGNISYGIEKDQFNEATFKTVTTTAVRLEVKLQN
ncbi:MAG: beta-L-arabinofuranosidase domain-containing protein, partial [Anaerohalosphaeraceae bacterium]